MRLWRWSHAPYWGSSENAYHRRPSAAHPDLFDQLVQHRIGGAGTAGVSAEELQEVRAGYYAMVSLVDDEVGRILATLEYEGPSDNTVEAEKLEPARSV